jgi:hypothetical protein
MGGEGVVRGDGLEVFLRILKNDEISTRFLSCKEGDKWLSQQPRVFFQA